MSCRHILRTALIASTGASSAFAGFTVTKTLASVAGGFERYDIVAVNSSGDTGTQIKSLEFSYYSYASAAAAFQVDDVTDPKGGDPDGIPDTVNLLSQSRTRVRVSTTIANNQFSNVNPTSGYSQPNPYAAGAQRFSGTVVNAGTTQATGVGFQIARIYFPIGGIGVFGGKLQGETGPAVPFSIVLSNYFDLFLAPIISNNNASTTADFGLGGGNVAPFSIQIEVTDPDSMYFGFQLGALPAGLSDVTFTADRSPYRATYTISGYADTSLRGTTVSVPFLVEDSSPFGPAQTHGTFFVHVTPEPFAMAAPATLCLTPRRRLIEPVGACTRRRRSTGRG